MVRLACSRPEDKSRAFICVTMQYHCTRCRRHQKALSIKRQNLPLFCTQPSFTMVTSLMMTPLWTPNSKEYFFELPACLFVFSSAALHNFYWRVRLERNIRKRIWVFSVFLTWQPTKKSLLMYFADWAHIKNLPLFLINCKTQSLF